MTITCAMLSYFIVCGFLSAFLMQRNSFAMTYPSSSESANTRLLRMLFWFVAGGAVVPVTIITMIGVAPAAFFAAKKLK